MASKKIENATGAKEISPQMVMPELAPLRKEISEASAILRAAKDAFYERDDIKALPKEKIDPYTDSEVIAQNEKLKALLIKNGTAMQAAGNPTFLPFPIA